MYREKALVASVIVAVAIVALGTAGPPVPCDRVDRNGKPGGEIIDVCTDAPALKRSVETSRTGSSVRAH
jgi:hypothetical protein